MRAFVRIAVACAAFLIAGIAIPSPWNQVVVKGYDVVAYFSEGVPVAGKATIASTYRGGIFRFASQANRRAFEQDPEKYVPQYGGFCALAMTQGVLVDVAPEAFVIHEGKLYLARDIETLARWQQNAAHNIRAAKTYWPDTYSFAMSED